MSLIDKLKEQHERSVAQMRQAKQELKKTTEEMKQEYRQSKQEARNELEKATQEVKEAWEETKQAGQEYFQEAKEHFKMAGQELKSTMEQIKEVWTKRCPSCNSTNVKKHKQKVLVPLLLALFVMVFGTIFLGFLGFLIGSVIMIIPGWRILKNSISFKYQCQSCGHIFKA